MEPDVRSQVAQRMQELPEDVRQAILSNDSGERINEVARKHDLHVDQTGALGDEAMLVMLGFTEMDRFAENIAEQVKVPPEEARKIADDITNALFLPIRESLKRFSGAKAAPASTPEVPKAPAPQAPDPVEYPQTVAAASQSASTIKIPPTMPKMTAPMSAPAPTPAVSAPQVPKELENPLAKPELPVAEKALVGKTAVVLPAPAPESAPGQKPQGYKLDPYREPLG